MVKSMHYGETKMVKGKDPGNNPGRPPLPESEKQAPYEPTGEPRGSPPSGITKPPNEPTGNPRGSPKKD